MEMNIDVIKFLLEHGADPHLKCSYNQKSSIEMAKNHCQSEEVTKIIKGTKQKYFHPKVKQSTKSGRDEPSILLDN